MPKNKFNTGRIAPEGANTHLSPDNRWELLHSVRSTVFDNEALFAVLEALAKFNDDLVLQYKLRHIEDLDNKERQELLKKILSKLSPQEFNAILHTARTYQPMLLSQHKLAKVKAAADKQSKETDELHEKSTKEQVVETFLYHLPYFMHSVNEITIVTSDFITHLNQSTPYPAHTNSAEGIATTVMLPAAGIFGAFQVGYDVALHNVLMRNAFTEYANEILRLDKKSVDKILHKYKNDPDAQIEHIKLLAKERMSKKLYNNTLYAGAIYSIFFSMILSFVAPLPFIYAIAGMLVTFGVANKNRRELESKLDSFMHQPQLDLVTLRAIQANKDKDVAHDNAFNFAQIPAINRLLVNVVRFSVLIWAGILAFSPLIVGIVAAVNSVFTWSPLRLYLRTLRDSPRAAIGSSVDIDIERTSITANFGRNYFKQYLLNEKGLSAIEHEMIAANIPIKHESRLKTRMRSVMSALGIWEKSRFNNILDALYDGTNPESIKLLAKLRSDAKDYAFEKRLSTYLANNHKRLVLDPDLQKIRSDHLEGKSEQFYKLMRNYLEAETLSNVRLSIWGTGFTTTVGAALFVVGLGLTFFAPLAPFFAIAGVGILAVGIAGIFIAEKIQAKKVRNAMATVTDDQFKLLIDNNQHQHMKNFAGVKANNPSNEPPIDAYNKSLIKIIKAYLVKPKKQQKRSMQDTLLSIKDTLSNITAQAPREYTIANNADRSITMSMATKGIDQTLLTVPRTIEEQINLHDGSTQGWQLFMALLVENNHHEFTFSLGTSSLEKRAAHFVEALMLEFSRPDGIKCTLNFNFADLDTADALYRLLKNPDLIVSNVHYTEQELDKVRAHFGMILINGHLKALSDLSGGNAHPFAHAEYNQNTKSLTRFLPDIQSLELMQAKPTKAPLSAPNTRNKPKNLPPNRI